MKHFKSVALLLIVAGVACAPPIAQESPELAAQSDDWEEALNTGNIDALVAMYSEDTILMPPNEEAAQGHEAVRAAFGAMIDAGLTVKLETISAVVAGNVGHRVGTYTLMAPGGATADQGKFIDVWEEIDGEWVTTSDIWNSDVPIGAGVTTFVFTHTVEDADHWLAAWQGENSRRDFFAPHGVANMRVFQSPDDPNLTGLIVDVTDVDEFQAFVASPDVVAAKAEDGVKDKGMQFLAEVK